MASIDSVIQALKDYTGTLIFVSHDLHFIKALGKRTIRIEEVRSRILRVITITIFGNQVPSTQTGLIEGLRDARPDQVTKTQDGTNQ